MLGLVGFVPLMPISLEQIAPSRSCGSTESAPDVTIWHKKSSPTWGAFFVCRDEGLIALYVACHYSPTALYHCICTISEFSLW